MTAVRRPLLPWVVWGVSVLAYAIAVVNRSSLAALGPEAQQHFGIDATTLSAFAVMQLLVYAGMQIPVGVLLDRFGPTIMLLSGGVLMMLGQLAMATAHDVWLAILARVLVGAGDACTFISVMRLLPDWFSVRQLPIVGQLTGLIGQAGQLVSVVPLALAVSSYGWTAGFVGVAAIGLLVTLLSALVLRDWPGQGTAFERLIGRSGRLSRDATSLGVSDSTAALAAVEPPATGLLPLAASPSRRVPGLGFFRRTRRLLSVPGVRLAYWVHFATPFSATMLVLLWGTPFFIGGLGLNQAQAGGLLSLMIVSGMVSSLVLGPISSRFAKSRVWIAIGVTVLCIVNWVLVLLWPGTPPIWLIAVLMIVVSIGGPTSMIAFEVARTHTPRSFAGFGTGLVNTGGFTSALLAILFVGLALDWQGAGSPEHYSLDAFRWAFATLFPILLLGLVCMMVELRRTQRWMRENGRTMG